MKAYLRELQHGLTGALSDSDDVLDYFSTDGSIFTIRPEAAIYPTDVTDVRNVVKFAAERAAAGKKIGVVARGKGTDQSGGALGDGLMLVFPAHMNRLVRLSKKTVTVQPGLLYSSLQRVLHSHNRFLPPYPSSIDFSTIGGAVANNASGEKTIKYGSTCDYIEGLQVVLADGSMIETKRLSAGELHHKKGLATLEGEIYRKLDNLLVDNAPVINEARVHTSKNSAGYNVWGVKRNDGSFDLSQIIAGSQGTLGIVTEITLRTSAYFSKTSLVVGYFDTIDKAGEAVLKLQKLAPSALEIVDFYLLDFLRQHRPEMIEGLLPDVLPKIVLLIEFDNPSNLQQTLKTHRAQAILKQYATSTRLALKQKEQEELWKLRHSAAAVVWMNKGAKKALPIIEDGVVPVEKLPEFLDKSYKLLKKYDLQIAVWGHAGDGNLHMQPFMDLSKPADRQKVLDLADDFYDMVIKMGGSTCGEHNDGLLRSRFLKKLYGGEMYEVLQEVKQIFDPQDILNPGKKTDMTRDEVSKLIKEERHGYALRHLYDHLPHN
jgi:FAD/FMN-containing dehydrogenase